MKDYRCVSNSNRQIEPSFREDEANTMKANIYEQIQFQATDPTEENPPELLPLDSANPWGLEGAARQVLGLLSAGERPSDRLYAICRHSTLYTCSFGITSVL